jgi:hypothetical protein
MFPSGFMKIMTRLFLTHAMSATFSVNLVILTASSDNYEAPYNSVLSGILPLLRSKYFPQFTDLRCPQICFFR